MQKLVLSGVAAIMAAAPVITEANPRTGDNPGRTQNVVLKAEWERARAIGGYEDPFTAFANVLNGTVSERTIQPKIRVQDNEDFEQYKARVSKERSRTR